MRQSNQGATGQKHSTRPVGFLHRIDANQKFAPTF